MPFSATASGDLQNALKKLMRELNKIRYTENVDWIALRKGDPMEYLRLFHYVFLEYSPALAAMVINIHGMELYGKTDKEFIGGIFKILLDEFNYRALLTRDQFLTDGFAAELKALIAADVISLIRKRYNTEHTKKTVRFEQKQKSLTSPLLDIFPMASTSWINNNSYKENEASMSSLEEEIMKLKAENRELRAIVSQSTSISLSIRSTLSTVQNETASLKEALQKCNDVIEVLNHKVNDLENKLMNASCQNEWNRHALLYDSNPAY